MAMLGDHVQRSVRRNLELLASHRDPAGFLAALPAADRSQDPLGRSPMLHIELILYAARSRQYRSGLAELQAARQAVIAQIIRGTGDGPGGKSSTDADRAWPACCWRWRTACACTGSSTRTAPRRTASRGQSASCSRQWASAARGRRRMVTDPTGRRAARRGPLRPRSRLQFRPDRIFAPAPRASAPPGRRRRSALCMMADECRRFR